MGKKPQIFAEAEEGNCLRGNPDIACKAEGFGQNCAPENAAGQLRDNSDEISVQQQQLSKKVNGSEQVGV